MKIKQVSLKNLGPISGLRISPRTDSSGNSIPIAIVGQNGAGKSLTLSAILDAMTEARRQSFSQLKEVGASDYIKLSSKNYIQHNSKYSHANITFSTPNGDIEFNEVVSKASYDEFSKENPIPSLAATLQSSEFKTSGFHKGINVSEAQKSHIKRTPFLYFPYFRYEAAYWMSEKANIDFVKTSSFYGHATLNPIRTNIIEETKRWILNLLLDRELYERQITRPKQGEFPTFLGYSGPNTQIVNLVNEIITTMLRAKNPSIASARIGIGRKGNRDISVIASKAKDEEYVVAPDISQLSSGELMTLGLTTEIVRAFELSTGTTPSSLSEVVGIVLVDEIDLHLHISFQKSVLPQIIRKLPNVQFIFTTHSPFLLLGMAEGGEIDIYNLPVGNKISPEEFTEFNSSYEIFINKNNQFKKQLEDIEKQAALEAKPLLITEGKTDWKHLKYALNTLKKRAEFETLDVDFFEFEDDINMGDIRLSQMCEHMATLAQKRKLIFVFDRDNPDITKRMSGAPGDFKDWKNNVYSICLPTPAHRTNYKNLNIELYYTDDTLRTTEPTSGKRLWFSNEIAITTQPTSGKKTYLALNSPNEEDEFDKKVFDQPADKIVNSNGTPVGLSKSAFVEVIIQNVSDANKIDLTAFSKFFAIVKDICITS